MYSLHAVVVLLYKVPRKIANHTLQELLSMFEARQDNNTKTSRYPFALLFAAMCLALPVMAMAKTALIETPLGNIEIELLEADAPETVANFLNYIESNSYNKSFIHRSSPGFVIQGGGFTFIDDLVYSVETFPAVANEFKVSNTRGTVAMAKLGGQPDSATSQWFINLADNSANLDNQNGGFTVFARVIGDGMAVADAISQLPIIDADGIDASTFNDLPVIDYSGGKIVEENLVMTAVSEKQATQQPPGFVMNAGLNDAWYNPITDGQGFFITVFPDLGVVNLAWFTYDTELPAEGIGASLGDAGHRWLTAIGTVDGDSAVLTIDFTSGGLFDTASEVQHTDPPGADGTITLSFADCNSGLVEYDITSINKQGSVPIQRVANDNIALCETLTGE
jgi:cyclophilin family peptidyl-prolyl cis-trans isomerase